MTTTLIITIIGLFLCGALAVLVCMGGYKNEEEYKDDRQKKSIDSSVKRYWI